MASKEQIDYLYYLITPKGLYVGKLKNDKPVEDHTRRLWKKFSAVLNVKDADNETDNVVNSDPNALIQLETDWLKHVLQKGFHWEGNNAFITSAGVAPAATFAGIPKEMGVFKEGTVVAGDSVFTWLQKIWNKQFYEIVEALLIMLAAKDYSIHNTKIDFLPYPAGVIDPSDTTQIFLAEKTFASKIKTNLAKLPRVTKNYTFSSNIDYNKAHPLLQYIFTQSKERNEVMQVIAWKTQKQVQKTTKAKNTKINKREEEQTKKTYITGLHKAFSGEKVTIIRDSLHQLASLLSEYTLKWYNNTKFSKTSFTAQHDNYTGYSRIVKNKIANLFQKEFESITGVYGYAPKSEILKKGVFKKWTYITTNWYQFYAEQLSIHYGQKFGPLQVINQGWTEFGDYAYEFGRPKLKKGDNIRVLFTSITPEIEDDVHKVEFMTIY